MSRTHTRSLAQRILRILRWPWLADPLPARTPSGLACEDVNLMRLAWAAMKALDARRLRRGRRLVHVLIRLYPDCIWGYELYDRFLARAYDPYEPERSLMSERFHLRESIRNFQRILALNPQDRTDVYFVAEYESIHYRLARCFFDATMEARSAREARETHAACLRHVIAWMEAVRVSGYSKDRVSISEQEFKTIVELCADEVAFWTTAGSRATDIEKARDRWRADSLERRQK